MDTWELDLRVRILNQTKEHLKLIMLFSAWSPWKTEKFDPSSLCLFEIQDGRPSFNEWWANEMKLSIEVEGRGP
jgi:hypothetical protein